MGTLIAAAATVVAIAILPAAAAAAPGSGGGARGCSKTPGAPEQAAILQYCPKKADGIKAPSESAAVPPNVGASGGGPGEDGARKVGGQTEEPMRIPLLDYPAGDAVGTVFWILLAVLAMLLGRFLYRRYLADRIGSGNRISTPREGGR